MKHSRIVIILALILLLGSCAGRHTARTLDSIALLADDQPDSALALLDSLAPHLGNSTALRARHTVLTAHARYKADLPQISIPKIEEAASEFMLHPTPATRYHVLCFFHLGIAREADSLYAASLVAYTRAEQAAKTIGDNHQLGLIYQHMASVYDAIYHDAEAVHYGNLALKAFQKGSPQPYIDYAMFDMALYYNGIGDHFNSLVYADSVLAGVQTSGDLDLYAAANKVIACVSLARNQYEEAIEAYLRIIEATDSLDAVSVGNLATALINTGRISEAKQYLEAYVPSEPCYASAYSDYNIVTGNYVAAIKGIQQDVIEQDRVIRAVLVQNVSSSVRESFEHETMMLDQKVRINRTLWISISVIALLTIALLVYAHQVRMLHQRNQVTEALSTVQELTVRLNATNSEFKTTSQQLHDTTRQLDFKSQLLSETTQVLSEQTNILNSTQQGMQAIIESRISSLESLCDMVLEMNVNTSRSKNIFKIMQQQIREFRENGGTISQIENIVNLNNHQVMAKFRTDFPQLKSIDYIHFLYIIIRLSSRSISVLLDIELKDVYSNKGNLKKIIVKSQSPNKDQYLGFFKAR